MTGGEIRSVLLSEFFSALFTDIQVTVKHYDDGGNVIDGSTQSLIAKTTVTVTVLKA